MYCNRSMLLHRAIEAIVTWCVFETVVVIQYGMCGREQNATIHDLIPRKHTETQSIV